MAFEKKSFNEVLKERELREQAEKAKASDGHIALDDSQRVKVLSPGRLVFKRFIRNRLAIVGTCILIFMFLFSFVGPLFYSYGQTQRFYKHEHQVGDYAGAQFRTDFTNYAYGDYEMSSELTRRVNSAIIMIQSGEAENVLINVSAGNYIVEGTDDEHIYEVLSCKQTDIASFKDTVTIGTINTTPTKSITYSKGVTDKGQAFYDAAAAAVQDRTFAFTYDGVDYEIRNYSKIGGGTIVEICDRTFRYIKTMPEDFETLVLETVEAGQSSFLYEDEPYLIVLDNGTYKISRSKPNKAVMLSTTYVFNAYETGKQFSDTFKADALMSVAEGKSFTEDGVTYHALVDDPNTEVLTSDGTPVAQLTDFVVRAADGKDTFDVDFKDAVEEAVRAMEESGAKSTVLNYNLISKITDVDKNGKEIVVIEKDENGNDVYKPTAITIRKLVNDYELTCPILRKLFDTNASPSSDHLFGTDSDGYDVLARMMYGGRISLIVGFVVVILETLLGTLMGGIAGYFGGWVDNLIMRLVDIFYCIPSLPILIIMGAYMDSIKMGPYPRLLWMMAILGFLGWAGVARLVRGQILSLREQEFMVATEATGVRVRKRIFRHLVPNVMPQLIVTATAGLGSVIITESTLSFLGLGVKHPLATWGNMINFVTQSNENINKYTYIWVPVGLLICLTVIAFNFVGDGLRDAFDPKMKK